MDVSAYLRRIGYDGSLEPSLSNLRALHLAHLRNIPFENLDIHWGTEIVLDEHRLFDKIVSRHRGGFCYELNGLFAALLRELGYKVTLLSARVAGVGHKLGPEFDHLTLRVDVTGVWLVDVGFGDCFLEPLELEPVYETLQAGVNYRLASSDKGQWALARRREQDTDWQLQYAFTLVPRQLHDFADMCVWHQTSPNSHFTRTRVCTSVTEHGRITLTDSRLIITEGGQRMERDVTEDEFISLLQAEFGISRDGRAK